MAQQFGIKGLFTTGMSAGNFFVNDAAREILTSYPGDNGNLFALTSALPSQSTNSRIFEWKDETIDFPIFKCGAEADTTKTEIVVANAQNTNLKMCVISDTTTGEDMYVTDQDGNKLTVVRGFAGTEAKAVTADDEFVLLAQATPEASYLPPPKFFHTTFQKNFIQKIVSTTEIDEDALKEKTVDGYKPEQYIRERSLDDHAMQVERALMFGKASENIIRDQDGQDKKLYTTDGLMAQIKTNRINISNGEVSLSAINTALSTIQERTVKGHSNNGHIAFVSHAFLHRLNDMVSDKAHYNISYGEAQYGIKIMRMETGSGTVNFVGYKLFDELAAYRGTAVVFNPTLINTVYFEKTNVRKFSPIKFVVMNALVTQVGLRVRQERCHGIITGLMGALKP